MLQTLSREDQTVDTVNVLSAGIDQLREEHRALKSGLLEFYELAKAVGEDRQVSEWSGSIQILRRKITAFMEELDVHSDWEDHVLFPMVQDYTGRDMGAVAVIEHEHELAKQNVRKFLQAADRLSTPVNGAEAKEAASYLLQAHVILSDHFRKEEEVLFPIAEQMLTDFEQFFS